MIKIDMLLEHTPFYGFLPIFDFKFRQIYNFSGFFFKKFNFWNWSCRAVETAGDCASLLSVKSNGCVGNKVIGIWYSSHTPIILLSYSYHTPLIHFSYTSHTHFAFLILLSFAYHFSHTPITHLLVVWDCVSNERCTSYHRIFVRCHFVTIVFNYTSYR